MQYCSKCGKEIQDDVNFCPHCGQRIKEVEEEKSLESKITTENLVRFILTFFLGFIGSIIINNTTLKPKGYKCRTYSYLFIGIITAGIYCVVASICNLFFDPNAEDCIGYFKE